MHPPDVGADGITVGTAEGMLVGTVDGVDVGATSAKKINIKYILNYIKLRLTIGANI